MEFPGGVRLGIPFLNSFFFGIVCQVDVDSMVWACFSTAAITAVVFQPGVLWGIAEQHKYFIYIKTQSVLKPSCFHSLTLFTVGMKIEPNTESQRI